MANHCSIIRRMPIARCKVAFTDADGVLHAAQVQAESLYEAVALAISVFRGDSFVPQPGPGTEFVVTIEKPAVEHRIRLAQVQKWAEATTREGPAGVVKRQKVKELLG